MTPKLLYTLGGSGAAVVAAVTVALTTGFNPFAPATPEQPVQALAQPQPEKAETETSKPAEVPAAPKIEAPAAAITAPVFGVVRVEPDGSLVVAGTAAPNASVQLLAGTRDLGTVKAGAEGDFAIVLDNPLKPGNYQLVLRATQDDGTVATSVETAVVAVPESTQGQVLALVERPGEPSRLISKPEPEPAKAPEPDMAKPEAQAQAPAEKPVETAKAEPESAPQAETPAPAAVEQAAATPQAPAEPAKPAAIADAKVLVEAVEIEGKQVFVAGSATPGARVRVYANDMLLGEAVASDAGRFLVEATRDLPVGDYIIRADMMDKPGTTVLARASVPFVREEGEKVAAVAPAAPQPAAVAKPSEEGTAKPEPAATQAAPLEAAEGSVIIRKGDSLWRISRRVYGRGVRYSTIYLANQEQITDPHRIWPGQVFKVPGKTPEGENADMTSVESPVQDPSATR